jgi:uncharacterized membrane protein YgdD (TMEM256/DUF423 family)
MTVAGKGSVGSLEIVRSQGGQTSTWLFIAATFLFAGSVFALTMAESRTSFSILLVLGGGCAVLGVMTSRGRDRSG